MRPQRPRIVFVGRSGSVSRALTAALESAGYVVTSGGPRARPGPAAFDVVTLVAHEALSAKALAQLLSADGSDGRRKRSLVFVATPTAGRDARGAPAPKARKPAALRSVPTTLRALRERIGRTQLEISQEMPISQSQLSRLEGRHDHLVSTLRKYVDALGGEIEVAALVGGTRFALRDV